MPSFLGKYRYLLKDNVRNKILIEGFRIGFHFISVRPNPLDPDKPVMTALGFLGRLPGGKFIECNQQKAR